MVQVGLHSVLQCVALAPVLWVSNAPSLQLSAVPRSPALELSTVSLVSVGEMMVRYYYCITEHGVLMGDTLQ